MVQTVVVLGAGWAGLPLAHRLLKNTAPKMNATGLKVILVSPNSHFYWNVAAVRGVIPGAFSDEQLFYPIAPGFAQYNTETFEFILGKAEALNSEKNTVNIQLNDSSSRNIQYDHLVIATGSQIRSNLPFKPLGTHEATLDALHSLQDKIRAAKSILVAGSGPTGIETAGELAAAYGHRKEITLVLGTKRALQASEVLPSVSETVEKDLQKLGVKLIRDVKVQSAEDSGDQTIVTLTDSRRFVTDCYLPLFGIRLNTAWLPGTMLDHSSNLLLDKNMRVQGTKNIWGVGDVGNKEPKQVTVTDAQILYLAETLDLILTGQEAHIKEYKPSDKTMIFVTMGKTHATGQIGKWKLWGWIVAYVKGRKIFVDTAANYVNGKALRHA